MNIPDELRKVKVQIEEIARGHGLDFFKTYFLLLSFNKMNEVASYSGFPTRYPHWKFGMAYERMSKGYKYGLQKIYEMVINNDPCYAYLLQSNTFVDQKIVIAHVYAHCDFFKNNHWFKKTNRNMLDEMANHGTRVRRYIEKYGLETVESFIDTCLSLENLIDYHSPFIVRKREKDISASKGDEEDIDTVKKISSKAYMDKFINPEEFIQRMKEKIEEEKGKDKKVPEQPEKDILLFLIEYAPLKKWELDILSIIREESYYFSPQGQTKIMNEGWATYWHSKIMTEGVLTDSELIDYADHHSGTLAQQHGRLNPYKIGVELFRDIEDRWNKGKFGKEYEECDDMRLKKSWDKRLGLGRDKIFEVRKVCNDITFIDNYLTKEFCCDQKLFTYRHNKEKNLFEIADRDFNKIKQKVLFSLTNFGKPFIYVEDANYKNRGELYLTHRYEGIDIDIDYGKDTLKNIYTIWKRPINLETIRNGKSWLVTYNGDRFLEQEI